MNNMPANAALLLRALVAEIRTLWGRSQSRPETLKRNRIKKTPGCGRNANPFQLTLHTVRVADHCGQFLQRAREQFALQANRREDSSWMASANG